MRFARRRVYAAVVVVLACAGIGKRASGKHLAAWRKATGVSARTVGRWLTWWRRIFVRTPLWVDGRAAFVPLVDETLLPGSLLERFDAESQLVALLRFVSPLSTGSVHAI